MSKICVGIDENKFYRGCYAKTGRVENGEMMDSLPPQVDGKPQLCYYIKDVEQTVTEKVPVKVYTKTVVSDTEFDTYYELKVIEEDREMFTTITEEEYNALSDEEKENVTITSIPKISHVEITKEEYESLSDEEKTQIYIFNKVDGEGNFVYEDVEKTIIVKEWAFSQEKYDELEAQRIADEEARAEQEAYEESISAEAQAAKIEELEFANEELSVTLDVLLTEVIPTLMMGVE